MHALIIGDEYTAGQLLVRRLQKAGYAVIVSRRSDFIIIDVMMSGMN